MATFVSDTFTDPNGTLLTNHVGEVGATWTAHPVITPTGSIQSNRAVSGSTAIPFASGLPATAEYDVQATLTCLSVAGNQGVLARHSTTANTNYKAHYVASATEWRLTKTVAGTATTLGTWADTGFTVAVTRTVKLEVRNATKKVYVDGVERISSTDDAITDAGRVGLQLNGASATAGYPIDDLIGADPAGGGQTIAIGQVAESDTAQAITKRKTIALGQATEAESAQPIAARKTRAIGQTSEIDAAQSIASRKTRTIAQSTEADLAQPIIRPSPGITVAIGTATESDTAGGIAVRKTRAVGIATETDLGQPIARSKRLILNPATETSTAQPIGVRRTFVIGQAVETDSAFLISRTKRRAIGQATEVDVAMTITRLVPVAFGCLHITGRQVATLTLTGKRC